MGYSKEIYDKVWEELSHRRRLSRETDAKRKQEVYAKLPQIREMDRQLAETSAGLTKLILTDPTQTEAALQKISEESLRLQEQRRMLLLQNGYGANHLEPTHHCARCEDRGYIGSKMCVCMEDLLKKEAYAGLQKGSPVSWCRFENFYLNMYPDQACDKTGIVPRRRMEEIFLLCKDYAKNFSTSSASLLFLGQTGLGKTHLSLAIAAAVVEQGFGVVYIAAQQLMDKLESEKFSRDVGAKEQYKNYVQMVLDCDLLVLDDLGAEFTTSFTNSVLYNIINTRGMEEKPTIINTNLELAAIEEKYTQRMVSRLVCGYKVLKFHGKDIRMLKKTQRTG